MRHTSRACQREGHSSSLSCSGWSIVCSTHSTFSNCMWIVLNLEQVSVVCSSLWPVKVSAFHLGQPFCGGCVTCTSHVCQCRHTSMANVPPSRVRCCLSPRLHHTSHCRCVGPCCMFQWSHPQHALGCSPGPGGAHTLDGSPRLSWAID